MKTPEEIKAFKSLVETIRTLNQTGWGAFQGGPLGGVKGRWRKVGKEFSLTWINPGLAGLDKETDAGDSMDIDFHFKYLNLSLERVYIGSKQFRGAGRSKIVSDVEFFHTKGFSKHRNYYFRLLVPLEKKLSLLFQLQRRSFADDFGWRHAEGTQATISGDVLQVCIFPDEKKKYYLSIESSLKQSFEIFSNKAHAVINGLGLLTGHLAGNSGWYFAYDKKDMQEHTHCLHYPMRNAIHGFYTPVNINPHAWVHDRPAAKKIYDAKILKPVSFEVFSRLCQKLYDAVDFSAAVLLMLEASVASLVFMPGGYAIVLESLADQIIGDLATDLAPMDKPLARKVRKELCAVIETECAHLPKENREILLGKINNINQITNKSRLRTPFDLLDIPLNAMDLELINTRNDFLHGRIPDLTGEGDDRTEERMNKDLYYASVRFYTLLSRLILAWMGYENYVLNHAKIQEKFTRIPLDEDYYLKALPATTIA
jgi:hypothetical protein